MVVGFGDEFAAAGFAELLEDIDDLGAECFELVEGDACDGVGHAEVALVPLDEVQDELGRREVALGGDLSGDLAVLFVVEIEGVVVEDGELPQAERLVDLEVEDD